MSADHAAPHHSPAWPADEPWHLAMPEGTLYDALARAARDRPSHPATVFYGASLSYSELRDRVDVMAGFLQGACGVKRGDRVMIALQNSPQYVIAYYAVMRADAVIVPVNPMNKTAEIDYIAADSGAKVAIIGSELSDIFAPLVGEAIAHAIVAQYRDEVWPRHPIRCRHASLRSRRTCRRRRAGIPGHPRSRKACSPAQ